MAACRTARTPIETEYRVRHVSGGWRWTAVHAAPVLEGDGSVREWVGMNTDITERKKAEKRERLLTNELAHRGKNLLAVVLAIVSRSLSGERTLAEAREVLSAAHTGARAESNRSARPGAWKARPLIEIVQSEFEAFSDRVEAAGPDVRLNSKAAQTFALLVHELATNASKHGALSRPGGRVAIHWSIEGADAEATLQVSMAGARRTDGHPSDPRGFGRSAAERAVARTFNTPAKDQICAGRPGL